MRAVAALATAPLALLLLAACSDSSPDRVGTQEAALGSDEPRAVLRAASDVAFPGPTDSNSPAHWSPQWGFVLFNSEGTARGSAGPDIFHMGGAEPVTFVDPAPVNGYRWIEATWKDAGGTLYGWYHNEPFGLCPGTSLTAPRIGAIRSNDDGGTWEDLGVVLEAPGELNCDAKNGYFAGGNGDFSVMPDPSMEYLYFFFSSFAKDPNEQGVSVARMRYAERDAPVGKVTKWDGAGFGQPGLKGRVTPIWRAAVSWSEAGPDAFWGPSIHYNVHLNRYVILVNRTKDGNGDWRQDGSYVSYGRELSDPTTWMPPKKIYDGGAWYPEVIGQPTQGTDKLAGRTARFFLRGKSSTEIVFLRPHESEAGCVLPEGLSGLVMVGGEPRAGVVVTAWGHGGDTHLTKTNPFGFYVFEDLKIDSLYNVAVNGTVHDNVSLGGSDCLQREDFTF